MKGIKTKEEFFLGQRHMLYRAVGMPKNPRPAERLEAVELLMVDGLCCLKELHDALARADINKKEIDSSFAPLDVYWKNMNKRITLVQKSLVGVMR